MGAMLGSNTEEEFVTKLKNESNSTLSSEMVYQIMMKTGCKVHLDSAKELLGLFRRFQALDAEKRGALTNFQFLTLDELMYNPFKPRLPKAIPFRPDDYIIRFRHSVSDKDSLCSMHPLER